MMMRANSSGFLLIVMLFEDVTRTRRWHRSWWKQDKQNSDKMRCFRFRNVMVLSTKCLRLCGYHTPIVAVVNKKQLLKNTETLVNNISHSHGSWSVGLLQLVVIASHDRFV